MHFSRARVLYLGNDSLKSTLKRDTKSFVRFPKSSFGMHKHCKDGLTKHNNTRCLLFCWEYGVEGSLGRTGVWTVGIWTE